MKGPHGVWFTGGCPPFSTGILGEVNVTCNNPICISALEETWGGRRARCWVITGSPPRCGEDCFCEKLRFVRCQAQTGEHKVEIKWTEDLNTGIDIIDKQHMQIVLYINDLARANKKGDRAGIQDVLDALVDYTLSHFAFEESLQEEADYKYCKPHKRVHELFIRRIGEYGTRFKAGEAVADELHKTLSAWLINHIKRDDADYVSAVKANMIDIIAEHEKKQNRGWFSRFFK
jgi:hemerythrin